MLERQLTRGYTSPRHADVHKAQNLGLRLERLLEKKERALREEQGNAALQQEHKALAQLHAQAIGCESELLTATDEDNVSEYSEKLAALETSVLALEKAEDV